MFFFNFSDLKTKLKVPVTFSTTIFENLFVNLNSIRGFTKYGNSDDLTRSYLNRLQVKGISRFYNIKNDFKVYEVPVCLTVEPHLK